MPDATPDDFLLLSVFLEPCSQIRLKNFQSTFEITSTEKFYIRSEVLIGFRRPDYELQRKAWCIRPAFKETFVVKFLL
jgi:hypothetical protein